MEQTSKANRRPENRAPTNPKAAAIFPYGEAVPTHVRTEASAKLWVFGQSRRNTARLLLQETSRAFRGLTIRLRDC